MSADALAAVPLDGVICAVPDRDPEQQEEALMSETMVCPRKIRELHNHHLPNVLFVHFAELKRDMPGQMRRIAAFLDIPIDEARCETICEYCSFDWMKQHATKSVSLGGAFWDAGAQVFIHRGVNGRWATTLTPTQVAAYEARALQELGPACARWLATGEGLG
jgi:aryl sulfotransferase